MQVPIVLPEASGVPDASGLGNPVTGSGSEAPSGLFALLLAQETAPQMAEALGQPVLVLPDGTIALEFDPASIPEGALVVNPPGNSAASGTEADLLPGLPEVQDGDSASAGGESAGLPTGAGLDSMAIPVAVQASEPQPSQAGQQETPEAAGSSEPVNPVPAPPADGTTEILSKVSPKAEQPEVKVVAAEAPVSKAVHVVAAADASVDAAAETAEQPVVKPAEVSASSAEYRVLPARAAPPEGVEGAGPAVATASAAQQPASSANETVSAQSVETTPAVPGTAAQAVVSADSAESAEVTTVANAPSSEAETAEVSVGMRNEHFAIAKAEASPKSESVPLAEATPVVSQDGERTDAATVSKPEGTPKQPAAVLDTEAPAPEVDAADSESRSEGLAKLEAAKVAGKTLAAAGETVKAAGHVDHAAAQGNTEATRQPLPETEVSFSQPVSSASVDKAPENLETVEHAWATSNDRPTLETVGAHVVKSVRYLAAGKEQSFQVRLVPESLGEMRVEVVSSNDTVQVKLISANATVRGVLEGQVEGLRDALAREGIDVSRLTVTADAGTSNHSGGFGERQASSNPGSFGRSSRTPYFPAQHQAPTGHAPPDRQVYYQGALNVYA